MTIEVKKLIELTDLLAIQMTCVECGAAVTLPLAHCHTIPKACGNCAAAWVSFEQKTDAAIDELLQAIKRVTRLTERRPFRFAFQVAVEPKPSTSQTSGPGQ